MTNVKKRKLWAELKELCIDSMMDYEVKHHRYKVFTSIGDTTFFVNLYKPGTRRAKGRPSTNDIDYVEFEKDYKISIDTNPPVPETVVNLKGVDHNDGKLSINSTARPTIKGIPMTTTFTGVGDDLITHQLGYGDKLAIQTTVGVEQSHVDISFDAMFGKVFVNEGYCMWDGAGFGDHLSISMFAASTSLQQVVDLDYVLDSTGTANKLRYVGSGNGTHGLASPPTLVPANEGPSIWGMEGGWWDYSPDTGLVPNAEQKGEYDIYDVEVEVGRFVNTVPVIGSSNGYVTVRSQDYAEIPNNYFLRFHVHNVSNTVWSAFAFFTLFRETTVDGNPTP